jgi:hypothetical protein
MVGSRAARVRRYDSWIVEDPSRGGRFLIRHCWQNSIAKHHQTRLQVGCNVEICCAWDTTLDPKVLGLLNSPGGMLLRKRATFITYNSVVLGEKL